MPLLAESFQCLVCYWLGAPCTLRQHRVVVTVTAEVTILLVLEVLDREHPVQDGLVAVGTLGQHRLCVATLTVGLAVLRPVAHV